MVVVLLAIFILAGVAQLGIQKGVKAGINPVMTDSTSGWGYDPVNEREYYMKNCRNPLNPQPIPAEYEVVFAAVEQKFGPIPAVLYLENRGAIAAPPLGPELVVRTESWPENLFRPDKPISPGSTPEEIAKTVAEYEG
jgi:hypothetical protein